MSSELLYIIAVMGFTWLITVGSFALLPYYTRKSIAFGIAVPPEQNRGEFLTGLRKHYVWNSTIIGASLALVSLVAILRLSEAVAAMVSVGAIFLYIVLTFIIYARCYTVVREYKRDSDWVVRSIVSAELVPRDDQGKLFNPLWYLTQLVPALVVACLSLQRYADLPPQLPTQYDFAGQVTTSVEKSYGVLMQMPAIMLLMVLLFAGIGMGINRAKRQTDDANVRRGLRNNRRFQIIMGQSLFWLGLFVQLILAATQLSMIGLLGVELTLWLTLIFLLAIAAGVVWVTMRVGQGGYRLSTGQQDSGAENATEADSDQYWRFFGGIYDNPDDPSVFVEKRVGVGWTINIGRPAGKVLLYSTLVLLAVLLVALPFLYVASN